MDNRSSTIVCKDGKRGADAPETVVAMMAVSRITVTVISAASPSSRFTQAPTFSVTLEPRKDLEFMVLPIAGPECIPPTPDGKICMEASVATSKWGVVTANGDPLDVCLTSNRAFGYGRVRAKVVVGADGTTVSRVVPWG